MSPEYNEQARREIVRQLQDKKQRLDAKKAEINEELLNVEVRIRRAQPPFPSGDICLDCWIEHGKTHEFRNIPSTNGRADKYECSGCGQIIERPER